MSGLEQLSDYASVEEIFAVVINEGFTAPAAQAYAEELRADWDEHLAQEQESEIWAENAWLRAAESGYDGYDER